MYHVYKGYIRYGSTCLTFEDSFLCRPTALSGHSVPEMVDRGIEQGCEGAI